MKVIDFHCDTLNELRKFEKRGTPCDFHHNDLHINLAKLQQGDYMLQCFAAFVNLNGRDNPLLSALEQIDIFYQLLAQHGDAMAQVTSWHDIQRNRDAGKISALLTIEDAGCCLGSLHVLRQLHRLGVRIMSLTWNYENALGFPNHQPNPELDGHDGLKPFGLDCLTEMERLNIIIDVSHLSDTGFWDVEKHATKPFIASHSNARTCCNHPRNLTDDMLKAIAKHGGITGINYCASFLDPNPNAEQCQSTVAFMADHISHIANVAGIDTIALGSDFDGIDNNLQMNGAHCLPMLETELRNRHFAPSDIEKIFHGNALRVLHDCLPQS